MDINRVYVFTPGYVFIFCGTFCSSANPVHLKARMSESRGIVNKTLDMNDLGVHWPEFAAVCESGFSGSAEYM